MQDVTKTNGGGNKREKMPNVEVVAVEMHTSLKEAVISAAQVLGVSLTQYVNDTLANKLGRPELGGSPRKGKPGRPPNRIVHAKPANGHHRKNGK